MSSTITLADQKYLKERFEKLNFCLSDYSFANTYLFRDIHNYKIEENFIRGTSRESFEFHTPLEYPFDANLHLIYYPIPESKLLEFPEDLFIHESFDSENDYLYLREKLETLENSPKIKKKVFSFIDEYQPEIIPFDKEEAKKVLESWNKIKNEDNDYDSCLEAIDLVKELDLLTLMVKVGQETVGFLLAEHLKSNLVVILFAKGKLGANGVYPYMNYALAKQLSSEIEWIDMQQDLGLYGLRKSKKSYHPEKMVIKYKVTRKALI